MDNTNNNNSNDRSLLFKWRNMKEIDDMLDTWIFNTIIRKKLRDLIIKEINKYKTNTNTNG